MPLRLQIVPAGKTKTSVFSPAAVIWVG